jgi:hypothetical protein
MKVMPIPFAIAAAPPSTSEIFEDILFNIISFPTGG